MFLNVRRTVGMLACSSVNRNGLCFGDWPLCVVEQGVAAGCPAGVATEAPLEHAIDLRLTSPSVYVLELHRGSRQEGRTTIKYFITSIIQQLLQTEREAEGSGRKRRGVYKLKPTGALAVNLISVSSLMEEHSSKK